MNGKRWPIHIIRDIVSQLQCLPSMSKSQIHSLTGMNFYQTEGYVRFLIEKRFITEIRLTDGPIGGTAYRLTRRGQELAVRIDDLIDFINEDAPESLQEKRRPISRHLWEEVGALASR